MIYLMINISSSIKGDLVNAVNKSHLHLMKGDSRSKKKLIRVYSGGRNYFVNELLKKNALALDTVYILEKIELQTGDYVGVYWNNQFAFTITKSIDEDYSYKEGTYYADFLLQLMEEGSFNRVDSLQQAEKLFDFNSVLFTSAVKVKSKYTVNHYVFDEFISCFK